MDPQLFLKILGILIGLFFILIGCQFLFRSTKIIQAIQKRKYKQTSEPRKEELLVARITGGLLTLAGLYYTILAVLSLF
ncbi:MAG: hypothetical protein WC479_02230 [Candidatus Izemoplasmatales bacterium]|jgi:uncharacterized membrane protein YfcA|nr:hypothetical protein [Candidatus Izemoplasmatales bacterium]MDD3865390.1 hypothetical protein [Candidatus Izemoplasmatales bacterium]